MFVYTVREAIKKSGKTYRAIAEGARIDLSTLVRLSQAKTSADYNASVRTIDALCRLLNCQPDMLLKYRKG